MQKSHVDYPNLLWELFSEQKLHGIRAPVTNPLLPATLRTEQHVCPLCGDLWEGEDAFCSCAPCGNCKKPKFAHLDGKCLFEPTNYVSGKDEE